MSTRKKQKINCKNITVREHLRKNRVSNNRKKRKIEEETEERERKEILGETMNSGSHKQNECANENTMDVPRTRNVLIKSNRWQAFANASKKSTNTELS